MKKQVDVVMLPTKNNKAPIDFNQIDNKLSFGEKKQFVKYNPQHLYFLSDEEIKEGDIVKIPCGIGRVKELHYKLGNDNPSYIVEDLIILSLRYDQKENEFQTNSFRFEDIKKIIATTDESLSLICTCGAIKKVPTGLCIECGKFINTSIPRPSNEFLKKYCELGGIDEVLVEYKCSYEDCNMFGCHKYEGCHLIQQLKVAPDNTISIYPITNETQFK